MRTLALLLLLTLTAPAWGQWVFTERPSAWAVTDSTPTYGKGLKTAVAQNRPLVVFVGCEPIEGEWVSCREPLGWEWTRGAPTVVVSRPEGGWLYWVADLPGGATAADIRARLRPAVQAVPFTTFQAAPVFGSRGRNC